MSRAVCQALGVLLGLSAVLRGQDPQAPQTTFRARVDVIQVDVSVLDRDRRPVSGLTAADFTLMEDGRPRPIVSFNAVHVPPPAPATGWVAEIAPDVTTNTHPPGRLVVIAIDDAAISTNGALWGVQKARAAARAAVKELGPDDLAALVLTEHGRTAQNFTNDRARLLAAIDNTPLFPATDNPDSRDQKQNWRASCTCGLCSVEGLQRVAESLRSLPQQRKTILYITPGLSVDITMPEFQQLPSPMATFHDGCEQRKHDAMLDVFRQAALANVTISAIDPNGIGGGGRSYPEFLRTIAENTGGRAITHDNEPERQVPALLLESSSYYLLGFESATRSADGAFHRIEVKVPGRDLEVRSRIGYFAPTRKELNAAAAAQDAAGSLEAAIGGHLPKADLPLQVSAAAFAEANRKSAVAIALTVNQPRNPSTGEPAAGTKPTTTVDVLARAFDAEGRVWGTRKLSVKLGLNAGNRGPVSYEMLPRLAVPPGKYEIRVAVQTGNGRSGSVYTFVDVPDFSRSGVSLSGIVLEATPAVAAAPPDAYADLLPVVPTARRDFGASDRVSAFVRAYQGGSQALVPATLTTRIVDAKNEQITKSTRELDSSLFAPGRAFDHRFDLPRNLAAGEYLFTVGIAAGGRTAERALRFRVR